MSERKWCAQYNIPRWTYRSWRDAVMDPKRTIRAYEGRPEVLDEEGKESFRANIKALQTATAEEMPRPAKMKTLAKLLKVEVKRTLQRAGMTQFNGNPVTVGTTSLTKYRDDIATKRKAHDLSNARYQALNNTQHMFQSAVMITATMAHLSAEQKLNFDCTVFECRFGDKGQVDF
jgi:hypothetical protein